MRTLDVVAGILLRGSELLLARRPAGKILGGYWELPGGKLEVGESPQACLQCEWFGELDVTIVVQDLFMESVHKYDFATIRLHSFLVKHVLGEFHALEHEALTWVDLDEINEWLLAPADVPVIEKLALTIL